MRMTSLRIFMVLVRSTKEASDNRVNGTGTLDCANVVTLGRLFEGVVLGGLEKEVLSLGLC